jgi:hypothetical protein
MARGVSPRAEGYAGLRCRIEEGSSQLCTVGGLIDDDLYIDRKRRSGALTP